MNPLGPTAYMGAPYAEPTALTFPQYGQVAEG
jgi:hypothetical protein